MRLQALIPGARRRHEARTDAAHQVWLAKMQEFHQPDLACRLVAAVDAAIAAAPRIVVEVESGEHGEETSVWWQAETDVCVYRMVNAFDGSIDYELSAQSGRDYNGAWLSTSTEVSGLVKFTPGLGFEAAERFLAWFEDGLR